ncbi:MAG TPA: sugar ABC transporter ATP-binding protein [Bryobacteraceae bacterium]
MLELRNIQKSYGGVAALKDGNLKVSAGEVHLLLGENGAGKSTLMKIVAGLTERDSGEMLWNGTPVNARTPKEAADIGVAMVHQECLLAPHLTVAENIFLGREDTGGGGWLRRRRMMEAAGRLIEEHRFPLRPEWKVGRLSPAGKQMVEICRALHTAASLLIFDEPTSSLTGEESAEVMRIVKMLRERKMGVIYITHRLEELRAIGDRVTVLRDGNTVFQGAMKEISTDALITHMVGRELLGHYSRPSCPPGAPLLEISHLNAGGKLIDVSLTLRAGEIVGMAGLIGAGRTELCRAIFGVDAIDSGEMRIDGRPLRVRSPEDAVKAGIALVTEDRQITGLATKLPIAFNMTLANTDGISRWGVLDLDRQASITAEYQKRLRIRMASPKQLAGRLSGGNQQKVVIGKWLFRGARVFLFDEPTRGIDVGAKVEVFDVMDELARSGAAVLMVSSEMQELLQVADRIVVMRQGRITGELPGRTTQEEIMRLAALEVRA